ncbi:GNAT family N-acetyltransferase [Algicella marina]|uniref:GNAT family N-acetyltransferase n=1 Tax=Algicella marina TaxID=2683284 RepID=A0A6P1T685_9RHOB|nr:GNAT family N-acetyltransferase [Algicella marina]
MMRLRQATPADIPMLRHWDDQPHVVAAGVEAWEWEEMLSVSPSWRELLIAETESRAIGFIQIIDPELEDAHYWGDCGSGLRAIDIWIGDVRDTGRGFGTDMMRLALARCFSEKTVSAVLIDPLASNTSAHRFYRRLGFQFREQRLFGDDDCFVFELTRTEWCKGD